MHLRYTASQVSDKADVFLAKYYIAMTKRYKQLLVFLKWACALVSILTVLFCYGVGMSLGHQFSQYPVPYLSYTGANYPEKIFFIIGLSTSSILFLPVLLTTQAGLILLKLETKAVKYLGYAGLVFGTLGAICLILLAVFDVNDYSKVHYSFALMFFVFFFLWDLTDAVGNYLWYSYDKENKKLRRSIIFKSVMLSLIILGLLIYVPTGVSSDCSRFFSYSEYDICPGLHIVTAAAQYFLLGLILTYIVCLRFKKYSTSVFTKLPKNKLLPEMSEVEKGNQVDQVETSQNPSAPIETNKAPISPNDPDFIDPPRSSGDRKSRISDDRKSIDSRRSLDGGFGPDMEEGLDYPEMDPSQPYLYPSIRKDLPPKPSQPFDQLRASIDHQLDSSFSDVAGGKIDLRSTPSIKKSRSKAAKSRKKEDKKEKKDKKKEEPVEMGNVSSQNNTNPNAQYNPYYPQLNNSQFASQYNPYNQMNNQFSPYNPENLDYQTRSQSVDIQRGVRSKQDSVSSGTSGLYRHINISSHSLHSLEERPGSIDSPRAYTPTHTPKRKMSFDPNMRK